MELLDSRRLTGPNLLWNKSGAVIDVCFSEKEKSVVNLWDSHVKNIFKAIGWQTQQSCIRAYPQGASLAISAPIDVLYTATEINEWCWTCAVNAYCDKLSVNYKQAADEFVQMLDKEANPNVLAYRQFAQENHLPFLRDDDDVSLGLGRSSQTWSVEHLADIKTLDPNSFAKIPVGLITGTNGKTTSVRLAAHIVRQAGLNAGISSTDWIAVNDNIIDRGDYSGPGGARRILRDKNVDVAILETARGGLLRRGLGVDNADAALITNVAEDHMGEFGVQSLEELADVKWIVTTVVNPGDRVVLNADDPLLVARAQQSKLNVAWFSIDSNNTLIQKNKSSAGCACTVEQGELVFYDKGQRHALMDVKSVPITLDGAATHNIQNTLGVIAFTQALGIPLATIIIGLKTFSDQDNPGRCNQFMINGAKVIVDFAHNPHGMSAFMSVARNITADRKLLVTGQAGDRSDEDIKKLARESVRNIEIDKIIIKKMPKFNRGREDGEAAVVMQHEFIHCGIDQTKISVVTDEIDAVNQALEWASPGDLVLLLIHEERKQVLERLSELQS